MKILSPVLFLLVLSLMCGAAKAQPAAIKAIFPAGTTFYQNIPYAGDTLKKHLLDIYLPPEKKLNYPLIVWIHGGAWKLNDKYADMSYMANTLKLFMAKGFAVASIDYRYSTTAIFPAQIQDCNRAIQFLYDNGAQYNIDADRIALIGFSAGGHLASLLALSNNNKVKAFYPPSKKPEFTIRMVLDFYGPSNLLTAEAGKPADPNSAITTLLGGTTGEQPELARKASPASYIDRTDPPFLIIQGEKDESVNPEQSISLGKLLSLAKVENEVVIVPGAPHYGEMFDAEFIRKKISRYLDDYMK